MTELFSYLITFLVGAGSGVTGKFLADKLTDSRRQREATSRRLSDFAAAAQRMPDLLRAMQHDLRQPAQANWREFFVVPGGVQFNGPQKNFLFYRENTANDYLNKVRLLEAKGYVDDITPGNAPMFRMSEEFVEMLLQWQAK